jgi:hypothetical protein
MEKGGVSVGMFHTSYSSFDACRTECVGQTQFSVMSPVSKKYENENHCRKDTENIRPPFPLSKCVFYVLIL